MEIFKDLLTLYRWGAKAGALKEDLSKKSIASAARDSILQFPCLISDSVPVNMANATAKYLDRAYADYVRIAISMISNVDISVDATPSQFLRKIHQNMKLESVEEDGRIIKEHFYDGDLCLMINDVKGIAFAFESYNGNKTTNLYKLNIESCREWLKDYDLLPFTEADDLKQSDILNGILQNAAKNAEMDREKHAQILSKDQKVPQLLNDRDVKKANDVQPYAIQIRLSTINENNEFVGYWDLVIGVKTILHLIRSDEIVDNIARSIANRSVMFNFIRWTTGEISFIKDLLLHLDDLKFDVNNRAKGYSAWFPTLKRLKDRKVSFKNFRANQLIPNSSLVISSYEVNLLEEKYGIIIKDVGIAKRLINNLFLMTLVILDDASLTMDILYQDSTSFETYALETIQREVSLNSNRLANEIGRMISSTR